MEKPIDQKWSCCLLPREGCDTTVPPAATKRASSVLRPLRRARSSFPPLSYADWRLDACVARLYVGLIQNIPLLEFNPPHKRQFPTETYILLGRHLQTAFIIGYSIGLSVDFTTGPFLLTHFSSHSPKSEHYFLLRHLKYWRALYCTQKYTLKTVL